MPIEIEAKMSVDSFDPVRAKLRECHARDTGAHFEVNTFFDRDGALRAAGEGLRLRLARDDASGRERHVITWKGPRRPGALKSREEVELEVASAADAVLLLEKLGYSRTLSFEKRRESWELGGCKIELDEVPHLGKFVEVEGPDEQTVMTVRARLGLSDQATISESYIGLLMNYLEQQGQNPAAITF